MKPSRLLGLSSSLGAAVLLGVSALPETATAATVLFHGAGLSDALAGADGNVLSHLQGRYGAANVTYMRGEDAPPDGSAATGFDLVVISSTLNSGTVRNKYEATPVGLVNWEQALFRQAAGEFNMSVGGATGNNVTSITINNPASPLAAGLSGTISVFNQPSTTQLGSGALGAGVSLVASAADGDAAGSAAIFAADVGDALLGDGTAENPATAAGRRVMFFIQDSSFDNLTPEGVALFNAATDWAAGIPEPSATLLALAGAATLLARRRRG